MNIKIKKIAMKNFIIFFILMISFPFLIDAKEENYLFENTNTIIEGDVISFENKNVGAAHSSYFYRILVTKVHYAENQTIKIRDTLLVKAHYRVSIVYKNLGDVFATHLLNLSYDPFEKEYKLMLSLELNYIGINNLKFNNSKKIPKDLLTNDNLIYGFDDTLTPTSMYEDVLPTTIKKLKLTKMNYFREYIKFVPLKYYLDAFFEYKNQKSK